MNTKDMILTYLNSFDMDKIMHIINLQGNYECRIPYKENILSICISVVDWNMQVLITLDDVDKYCPYNKEQCFTCFFIPQEDAGNYFSHLLPLTEYTELVDDIVTYTYLNMIKKISDMDFKYACMYTTTGRSYQFVRV